MTVSTPYENLKEGMDELSKIFNTGRRPSVIWLGPVAYKAFLGWGEEERRRLHIRRKPHRSHRKRMLAPRGPYA